jgi:hypothetical protein
MQYVIKEKVAANLVADADSLMRELYRGDDAINNLDQNNIRSASINYDTTYDPSVTSTYDRGCTRTHYLNPLPAVLYKALTSVIDGAGTGAFNTEGKWVETANSLDFSTPTPIPFSFYASGQLDGVNGSAGPILFDIILRLNGENLGVHQSFSASRNTSGSEISLPFFVTATAFIPAGDWSLNVAFRQWDDTFGDATGIAVAAIGYTR